MSSGRRRLSATYPVAPNGCGLGAVVSTLLLLALLSSRAQSQDHDLSGLTSDERQSIESACSYDKLVVGPGAYNGCVRKQVDALSGSHKPDLSSLTSEELQSIESVCSYDKLVVGAAAYNGCVRKQVDALSGSHKPDLSRLSSDERQSIESACSYNELVVGPSSYYACVRKQVDSLRATSDIEDVPRPNALVSHAVRGASQGTSQTSEVSSAEKRLLYFVGTWTITGEMNASPFGPAGKLTGTHRNEWVPGDHSLVSHWDEQRPSGTDRNDGIYRYDSGRGVYTYHGQESTGEAEDSTGSVDGDTWTWTSTPTPEGGKAMKGRFSVRETSPDSYDFRFEIAAQDADWTTVMQGTAVRSK
jgi:hypothetical protein